MASDGSESPGELDEVLPSTRQLRPAGSPPTIFGHRGMPRRAPENTLAAFKLIAAEPIAGVELDVHQCASGELVVAHDDTLARTAGVELRLRESPLDEIREHDVGSWFDPQFAGERVPTLAEVFELLGRSVVYDIEIKPFGTFWGPPRPDGPEATLMALIRRHGLADRCIVSSFDPLVLRRFSELTKDVPTALIYTNTRTVPFVIRRGRGRLFCRADILKPQFTVTTAALVRRQHARGRLVIPWTVDDPVVARKLSEAGVDGLISNVPHVIQSALRQPPFYGRFEARS